MKGENNSEETKIYVICATQRSGSTLLCSFLSQLNMAGNPSEFLLPEKLEILSSKNGSIVERVHQALFHLPSKNNVIGVKIMDNTFFDLIAQTKRLSEYANKSEREIIEALFPGAKYIFMTRRNKLRQAVSLSRAEVEKVWEKRKNVTSYGKTYNKNKRTVIHPFYVKNALCRVFEREKFWVDLFDRDSIQVLSVEYENLVESADFVLPKVLRFIQVECPNTVEFRQERLKKQADIMTEFLIFYYRLYFVVYNHLPKSVFGILRFLKNKLLTQ